MRMSDSDDTDLLLYIPPDFFLVHSPPCVSPVDYISTCRGSTDFAVDFLTHRVETFNTIIPGVPTMENGFVNSTPFVLKSYSPGFSANRNEFPPITASDLSPSKTNGKTGSASTWPLRNENFLQNSFEMYKEKSPESKIGNAKTNTLKTDYLSSKMSEGTSGAENENLQSPKFSLRQVDKLLSEMEKTREEIKNKLQSNKSKIYEMRKEYSNNNNTDENANKHQNMIIQRRDGVEVPSSCRQPDASGSWLKKQLNTDVSLLLPIREPKNMLHLSKIMSKDNDFETLKQKLEAENLKKKHCEEIIQQLQASLLEQQQNMNVALTIDAQKNEVIGQLRQSWTQLIEHWKELEHQRQELALMLEQERVDAANSRNNFIQKLEQLENRLHEAVSLANGYREKNEQLERTHSEVQRKMSNDKRELEEKLNKTELNVKLLEMEKVEALQRLEQSTNNLADEKEKRSYLESQLSESQIRVSGVTCERDELAEKYEQEANLVNRLKAEVVKLKLNYTRASGAEAEVTKEITAMRHDMGKLKNSLKEFYQKQLDAALREKVDEFQKEIDKVQALMHVELCKQEKLAEAEISRLKTSHKLEVSEERRINQKHVNILKSELKENKKKIYELENRLKLDSNAKQKLAELIQAALQTQRLDLLATASDVGDNAFKESYQDSSVLNCSGRYFNDDRMRRNEEVISDLEFSRGQGLPVDLKRYIEMLLEQQPSHSVDNYIDLKSLASENQTEFSDKKSVQDYKHDDNCRRKPPWK